MTFNNLFSQETVRQLREADFDFDGKDKIRLKYEDCVLILFYVDNQESFNLCQIFQTAAVQAVGPIFAACNCSNEKRVAKAFLDLNMMEDHPLRWAALQQFPFIVTYRQGWPQAFYNGERVTSALVDYSLTLACRVDYKEKIQKTAGMDLNVDVAMGGVQNYGPRRVNSSQYGPTGPIREWASGMPTIRVGAPDSALLSRVLSANSSAAPASQGYEIMRSGIEVQEDDDYDDTQGDEGR